MNKLSTKWFHKWAKKIKLSNRSLLDSINDLEKGLSIVNLGGHLFKVRVKSEHSGKSSSYRTLIVLKQKTEQYFFMGLKKMKKVILAKTNYSISKN
jgi:hypothetical protein